MAERSSPGAAVCVAAPLADSVPSGFRADLQRWQHLVSAPWLSGLLAGEPVAAAPVPGWLLLEVACDGMQDYVAGHIPGARYLDTRQLEHLPFWNAVPDGALQTVLLRAGIHAHRGVVLYGRNPLAAARVAHLLLYAGVQDVRLLDGGWAAWCAAGLAVQQGALPLLQAGLAQAGPQDWGAPFAPHPGYLVHLPDVRTWPQQPRRALVSIRSRAEFMGETSGYSYIARRGEIPGALWGHAGDDGDVNSMRSFHTPDGRMLPAAAIARMWAEAGIHPDLQIAFYCGTGWRASLAFFYAWLMGWERISVFDGGWMEWGADSSLPVECRAP